MVFFLGIFNEVLRSSSVICVYSCLMLSQDCFSHFLQVYSITGEPLLNKAGRDINKTLLARTPYGFYGRAVAITFLGTRSAASTKMRQHI